MRRIIDGHSNTRPHSQRGGQVWARAAMATACARDGRLDDALRYTSGIPEGKDRASAFLAIGAAQARDGRKEDAQTSWKEARMIHDESMLPWRSRDVAVAQAEVGFGEQAVVTAESIFAERNRCLPQVAEALAGTGGSGSLEAVADIPTQPAGRESDRDSCRTGACQRSLASASPLAKPNSNHPRRAGRKSRGLAKALSS